MTEEGASAFLTPMHFSSRADDAGQISRRLLPVAIAYRPSISAHHLHHVACSYRNRNRISEADENIICLSENIASISYHPTDDTARQNALPEAFDKPLLVINYLPVARP